MKSYFQSHGHGERLAVKNEAEATKVKSIGRRLHQHGFRYGLRAAASGAR